MYPTADTLNFIEISAAKIIKTVQEWFVQLRDQHGAQIKTITESSGETDVNSFDGLL